MRFQCLAMVLISISGEENLSEFLVQVPKIILMNVLNAKPCHGQLEQAVPTHKLGVNASLTAPPVGHDVACMSLELVRPVLSYCKSL